MSQQMPQHPAPVQPRPFDHLAVVALIFALYFPPIGWILGIRAQRRIDATQARGREYATAAVWYGAVTTLLVVLGVALLALLVSVGAMAETGHYIVS